MISPLRFLRNLAALPGNLTRMSQGAQQMEEIVHTLHAMHGEVRTFRQDQIELLRGQAETINRVFQLVKAGQGFSDLTDEMQRLSVHAESIKGKLDSLTGTLEQELIVHAELGATIKQVISKEHDPWMQESMRMMEALMTRVATADESIAMSMKEQYARLEEMDRHGDERYLTMGSILQTIIDHLTPLLRSTEKNVDLLVSLREVEKHVANMKNDLDDIRKTSFDLAIEDEIRALKQTERYRNPLRLHAYERQVFSQNGEDGAIEEIFRRIGTTNRVFAECGVSDGLESNTTYLLTQGWSGHWFEAHAGFCARIREKFASQLTRKQLSLTEAHLTAENIVSTLLHTGVPEQFDLLSVDIDGNDYWLWKAIETFHPRVVAIEYNALFPPNTEWIMEYDPQYAWQGTRYYGASLAALTALAAQKGYSLVGCELTGNNAFFVRRDLAAGKFASPFTVQEHYEPPRYYLVHSNGHRRDFGPFLSRSVEQPALQSAISPAAISPIA